jgi:hypothetical protein
MGSQQEQVREWIKNQKETGSERHYTEDSIVSKKKERIDSLVKAHWKYQENVLSVGQDKEQLFTWEQVMAMRDWDYCSSAKHFYGHGYEDAQKDMEIPGI